MNSKRVLPLPWILAGFLFLALYLIAGWKVTLAAHAAYGLIAAIGAVVGLVVLGRVAVTPLAIRFLESRKRAKYKEQV